jgi:2-keto-4-pentenoate hydratase
MRPLLAFATLLLAAQPALAECPSPAVMAERAQKFQAREPLPAMPGMSLADGACAQARLVEALVPELGPRVGWKAGLTNEAVQRAFGVSHPVRGALLQKMLLADGATVPARFGAAPRFESDLLVRVSDPAINQARTPEDVARAIDAVIPFIELPDLVLAQGERFDGPTMLAINVGARLGVMGQAIPVTAATAADLAARLASMEVVLSDDTGRQIARSQGSALMGNPLAVVVWLAQDLAAAGQRLMPGDLVSLGSFSPLSPPEAGRTITATYTGISEAPASVRVTFR